jgi:hypothetical protein
MMRYLLGGVAGSFIACAVLGCGRSKPAAGGTAVDGASAVANAPAGAAAPLAFLSGFEGEVSLKAQGSAGSHPAKEIPPLTLQVKSDKVRLNIPPGLGGSPRMNGYVVLNTPEKKLYVVMDETRQAIVVDLDKAGQQLKTMIPSAGGAAHARPARVPSSIKKTGTKDNVAGYVCENWDIADETRRVASICVAEQGASWLSLPAAGLPAEYAWATELTDGKHFPLRLVAYGKDGAEEGKIEVTRLEKKPIAASLFELPPGYKVVDMATVLKMPGMLAFPGNPPAGTAAGPAAMPRIAAPHAGAPAKKAR